MPGASPPREPVQDHPVPLREAVQHQRPAVRLVSGGAWGELTSATSLEPGEVLQHCPMLGVLVSPWSAGLAQNTLGGKVPGDYSYLVCQILSGEGTAHWATPLPTCRGEGRDPDVLCRVNSEHRYSLVGLCRDRGSKALSCSSWAQGREPPIHSRAKLDFCKQTQPGFQGPQEAPFSHCLRPRFPLAQSQSSGALKEVFHGVTA